MAIGALRQMGVPASEVTVVPLLSSSEVGLAEGCGIIHRHFGHTVLEPLILGQLRERSFARSHAALFERFRKARRLWSVGLFGETDDLLSHFMPRSLAVFEDGLLSTFPKFSYGEEWHRVRNGYSLLKFYIRRTLERKRLWLRPPLYQRLEIAAVFMESFHDPGHLPPQTRLLKIEPAALKEILQAGWVPSSPFAEATRPRALILGSNFVKAVQFSVEEEYGPLEAAIRHLEPTHEVWWKPHPRADPEHTEALVAKFPGLRLFPTINLWVPIEAMVHQAGFEIVASTMSSSLIYCKELWGMETFLIPGFEQFFKRCHAEDYHRIYHRLKGVIPEMQIGAC